MSDAASLPVEYEAVYRDSAGNLRLANSLDHANSESPTGIFRCGLVEETRDVFGRKIGVLRENGPDTGMISLQR